MRSPHFRYLLHTAHLPNLARLKQLISSRVQWKLRKRLVFEATKLIAALPHFRTPAAPHYRRNLA